MMDFTPTQRQQAAAQAYYDTPGLAALPLPAGSGGSGLSVTELAAVLHEAGKNADGTVVTLMTGTLPLVLWGARELLAGHPRVTAAPRGTARLASATGEGATVSGVLAAVPYAAESDYVLVAAGDAVAMAATDVSGVTITRTRSSSGEPEGTVHLDDVPVHALLEARAGDLEQLCALAACCLADGALTAALELTARHVATREQFGRPLATFQAVAQRIADIAIASRTVHLATLSAAWHLERDLDAKAGGAAGQAAPRVNVAACTKERADSHIHPGGAGGAGGAGGGAETGLAAYWVAETVARSVMDCHHLHGGIGMDTTYPLHRFSSLIADQVRRLGGAEYRLERLACTSI